MAIVESFDYAAFDESDPDDFRQNSRWAVLIDPSKGAASFVRDITVVFEEIAPGDRIPLHTHPIDEVIVVDQGEPEVTLGDEKRKVRAGAVVFIPAETPHGTHNVTGEPVRIHAMFPSQHIGIEYLERNPAPGTEDDPPQPAATLDIRALVEG